jgi:hypothetical protein
MVSEAVHCSPPGLEDDPRQLGSGFPSLPGRTSEIPETMLHHSSPETMRGKMRKREPFRDVMNPEESDGASEKRRGKGRFLPEASAFPGPFQFFFPMRSVHIL